MATVAPGGAPRVRAAAYFGGWRREGEMAAIDVRIWGSYGEEPPMVLGRFTLTHPELAERAVAQALRDIADELDAEGNTALAELAPFEAMFEEGASGGG